jgi:hypothetical protein
VLLIEGKHLLLIAIEIASILHLPSTKRKKDHQSHPPWLISQNSLLLFSEEGMMLTFLHFLQSVWSGQQELSSVIYVVYSDYIEVL